MADPHAGPPVPGSFCWDELMTKDLPAATKYYGSVWLAYIAVVDVEAKTAQVKELGGKIVVPVMDVEKVGKLSVVQDTSGASFALFRSARV